MFESLSVLILIATGLLFFILLIYKKVDAYFKEKARFSSIFCIDNIAIYCLIHKHLDFLQCPEYIHSSDISKKVIPICLYIADNCHQLSGVNEKIKDSSDIDFLASYILAIQVIQYVFSKTNLKKYEMKQKGISLDILSNVVFEGSSDGKHIAQLSKAAAFYRSFDRSENRQILINTNSEIKIYFDDFENNHRYKILKLVQQRNNIKLAAYDFMKSI